MQKSQARPKYLNESTKFCFLGDGNSGRRARQAAKARYRRAVKKALAKEKW